MLRINGASIHAGGLLKGGQRVSTSRNDFRWPFLHCLKDWVFLAPIWLHQLLDYLTPPPGWRRWFGQYPPPSPLTRFSG